MQQGLMHGFLPVDFPYTIGPDLAGTVEQVGPGVTGWHAGDRVVARTDPPRGGALAWQALFEVAGLATVQTVLVHAGAGGVGSFAIQLARHAGARVIATASANGLDTVRRLGANQVIDYRSERFRTGFLA